MRKIIRKLRSNSGETLVETMASILVFTLSSILLLSMIAAASKINYATKAADKQIAEELLVAEAQDSAEDGTVASDASITVSYQDDTLICTISVKQFSSGDDTLYSYTAKTTP